MSRKYKIEVVHDESGEVVKLLEYNSDRSREKAYRGLIKQMDLGEYTANLVGDKDSGYEG